MQSAFQFVGFALGIPLELLVLHALLAGGYKRYPMVFTYALAYCLTTAIEFPLSWLYYAPWSPRAGNPRIHAMLTGWYWRDEIALQFLVFLLVMSLVWEATAAAQAKGLLRASLVAAGVVIAAISFLIHFNPDPHTMGMWVTLWARDLNFSSAILDLAVWFMLIVWRKGDPRLLLLTGGLGIEFAGGAIGESLRSLSRATVAVGSLLDMVTNIIFLYIWWQTFRPRGAGPQ